MESKSTAESGKALFKSPIVIGIACALIAMFGIGLALTIREVRNFGKETYILQPLGMITVRTHSSEAGMTHQFSIRPKGGKVRFYYGPIDRNEERVSDAVLHKLKGTSQILDSDMDYQLTRSVPGDSCFWALLNEGPGTVVVDFQWK